VLARRLTGGLRLGRPQSSGFARRNLSRQALLVSVLCCRRRAGGSSRAVHSGRWRPSSRVLRTKRGSQVAKCGCGSRAIRLLERRATAHGRGVFRFTPFFRLRSGRPITVDKLRDWVKRLMQAIGLDPAHFGAHSLRIGGATALFTAGADPNIIRTMGRSSSDCYRLYIRACFNQTLESTQRAGSTVVDDVAGEFEKVDCY